jgi:deoxyribodipyrimidine photolyase-like uncharacterized protein
VKKPRVDLQKAHHMTFAKPYTKRRGKCGYLYDTDAPGARWTTAKGNPRYLHPGCQTPATGWKPATPARA